MSRLSAAQVSGLASHARRGANVGLTQRIRDVLKRGPMTRMELAGLLDANPESVLSMLQQAMNRTGGIRALAGTKPKKYALAGAVDERPAAPSGKGSGVIAGIVTIGRGMRWPGGIR